MPATQAVNALEENIRGEVISPADPGYDEARALYNGMIDKRPRNLFRSIWPLRKRQGWSRGPLLPGNDHDAATPCWGGRDLRTCTEGAKRSH
jgi:hypothetical protein